MSTLCISAFLAFGVLQGSVQAESGLTDAQADAVLKLHNKLRGGKNENQPCTATDMEMLRWDDSLASASQKYAEQCVGDHDPDAGIKFGENLWMDIHSSAYTTADLTKGVQEWYDEFRDTVWNWGANAVQSKPIGQCTDYEGAHCNVGHYYQVIWARAKKLGCGVAACSSLMVDGNDWGKAVYLVCRYDAPARIRDDGSSTGLPYMPGKLCAACSGMCSRGLCTSAPTRCVDETSDCKALVKQSPSYCKGEVGKMCTKSCTSCTQPNGIGYDQCSGWSPDIIPASTSNGIATCKLPALPLNSVWECQTADGLRSTNATSIGFYMYSIAYDPDLQCVAKCKPFSRGPLDTGEAIRFTQPRDHVAIAQKCTEPGKTLDYDLMAPQVLLDSDKFLSDFCVPIEECELPSLKESPHALYDPESCTMSPAKPTETAGRFLKDQSCKVECADGYELDPRYGTETGACSFPQIGDGTDNRILGSVGPPTWQGHYALPPVCHKSITSGWLSKEAANKCMNHAQGYSIPDNYKNAEDCPAACLQNSQVIGWGTEAKEKIVTMCHLMANYDNKYNPTVEKYCCCAKSVCFDEANLARITKEADGRLTWGVTIAISLMVSASALLFVFRSYVRRQSGNLERNLLETSVEGNLLESEA